MCVRFVREIFSLLIEKRSRVKISAIDNSRMHFKQSWSVASREKYLFFRFARDKHPVRQFSVSPEARNNFPREKEEEILSKRIRRREN